MNRQDIRTRIEETGIFPAVRVSLAERALFAAESVYEAGISNVEITMTVPGAVDVMLPPATAAKLAPLKLTV